MLVPPTQHNDLIFLCISKIISMISLVMVSPHKDSPQLFTVFSALYISCERVIYSTGSLYLLISLPILSFSLPSTLETTCLFFVSVTLFLLCLFIFKILHMNEIIQYLFCFPQHNTLQSIHIVANSFFFMVKINCIVCVCVCVCVYTPHLLYSSIYWWAQKLLPYFGYCKLSYNEHRSAQMFSNQCFHFVQIDTRSRMAGSHWQFYF